MGNPYPVEITDVQGEARLTGFADFTDPGNQPGGGSVPKQESLNGNTVNIANGDSQPLTWDNKGGGDTLLDISTPSAPVVLAGGLYAVSVVVSTDGITVGGSFEPTLVLDAGGDYTNVASLIQSAAAGPLQTTLSLVALVPDSGTIQVVVQNFDGANAVNFAISNATVVKVA